VLKKAQAGVIAVALDLQTEAAALETLMRRYEKTPCRWPMPAWCGFQNCTPIARCSRWTRISAAIAVTDGRSFHCWRLSEMYRVRGCPCPGANP
jgi:hypothetical protein